MVTKPAQVQIWALPGQPLKMSDLRKAGYSSIETYITSLIEGHSGHMQKACKTCAKYANNPLASFGIYDEKTGIQEVKLMCQTAKDLPTESIVGLDSDVLIFD